MKRMKLEFKTVVLLGVGVALIGIFALTERATSVTTQKATAAQSSATAPVTTAQQASVIYRDPATGQVVHTPPSSFPQNLSEEMKSALSTSSAGLVEQPSPVSGIVVNLQGRFRNLMTAERAPGSSPHINCVAGEHSHPATEVTVSSEKDAEE